jgi:flagellar hook-length control protein FliK
MKTSGPQQAPPTTSKSATDNKSTNKTDSKPQKEFKEVLDSDRSQAPPPKGKFGKLGPKGEKLLKKGPEENPLTAAGRKTSRSGKEDPMEMGLKKDDLSKKSKKEDLELKEFTVPTHVMMGPASIQPKSEVQKTQGPALNIKEIESIVQKVQVGINEKGLPEMNFELMTDKLGSLNLKISSENEKISIQFVTQDTAAQAELQKGMNDLSQLLGQRGLNLAETNVMTRDQQSQQQQQQDRGRGESETSFDTQSTKNRARKRIISGPSDDGFTI